MHPLANSWNRGRHGGAYLLVWVQLVTAAFATEPPITDLAFAPDGEKLVACSQSGIQVFSWPGLKRERTIECSASNLHCLAFSPRGARLAVGGGEPSEEGSVQVFSWPDGKSIALLDEHFDSVFDVAWSGDEKLLTASIDHEIKLWDLNEEAALLTYRGHSRSVHAICLLHDGQTFVSSGADQSLRVWSLESTRLVRSLNQHTMPVHSLALRPSEGGLPMVASAAGDRTVRLWQPTIGRMVRYVRLDAEPLSIAWLPDGVHIAAACVDGHVRVVDANEVKVTMTLPGVSGWAYAIAVHPTGSVVVGGSDGQVRSVLPTSATLP